MQFICFIDLWFITYSEKSYLALYTKKADIHARRRSCPLNFILLSLCCALDPVNSSPVFQLPFSFFQTAVFP